MSGEYYTFAGKDVPRYTYGRVFGVGTSSPDKEIRVSSSIAEVTKRVVDGLKSDDENVALEPACGTASRECRGCH